MKRLDYTSAFIYGIHGALGMVTGIGIGFLFSIIIPLLATIAREYTFIQEIILEIAVFAIYGAYIGYIFGGQGLSSKLSKLGVAAGIFAGLTGILAGNLIQRSSFFDPLFITLALAGIMYGFPNLKNMVFLAASGALGGALSYGIFILSEKLIYHINSFWMAGGLVSFLIAPLLFLLAIGLSGASIAIGMYVVERTAYTGREVPWFLKITRGIGIIVALLLLLFSSFMIVNTSRYASTQVSIGITSEGEKTIYVPVFLDGNGNVLEMYEKPTITGSAITAIIDTERGKALKISGSGAIEINAKQTHVVTGMKNVETYLNGLTFSMSNYSWSRKGGTAETWIYSEGAAEFSFAVKQDNGWGRETSLLTEKPKNLTKGWQAVGLTIRTMWYD